MTNRQAQSKHRASLRTEQPAANRWGEAAPASPRVYPSFRRGSPSKPQKKISHKKSA